MDPVEAEQPPADQQLDVITRTGDELIDAIIDFGEHSFQHGRAHEAKDWDRVATENQEAVLALGRVQELLRARGLTAR